MSAVADIAPGDAWLSGKAWTEDRAGSVPWLLHWDGTTLVQTASPFDSAADRLSGDAADDVWALDDPELAHWDGEAWTIVPYPAQRKRDVAVEDVVAISPTDAWAVGSYLDKARMSHELVMRWDGVVWSTVHAAD